MWLIFIFLWVASELASASAKDSCCPSCGKTCYSHAENFATKSWHAQSFKTAPEIHRNGRITQERRCTNKHKCTEAETEEKSVFQSTQKCQGRAWLMRVDYPFLFSLQISAVIVDLLLTVSWNKIAWLNCFGRCKSNFFWISLRESFWSLKSSLMEEPGATPSESIK